MTGTVRGIAAFGLALALVVGLWAGYGVPWPNGPDRYAAWFTVLGHGPITGSVVPGERYQAAVSVGTNPTFSGRTRTVEAFVLDTSADLYGQHVAVDFVARIRGQEKFDRIEELVATMGDDTERARTILSAG